mmetsp:Transcript_12894/g.19723  ORF Transcript_12894/g.19723 Transcript_12894/m.19723 type:complete len:106 (-) Transcript_12894:937-1254(-)
MVTIAMAAIIRKTSQQKTIEPQREEILVLGITDVIITMVKEVQPAATPLIVILLSIFSELLLLRDESQEVSAALLNSNNKKSNRNILNGDDDQAGWLLGVGEWGH